MINNIDKFREIINNLNQLQLKGHDLYTQAHLMKVMSNSLKERQEEINAYIIEEMKENKEVKKEFEFGKFTLAKRTSWEYSPKIDEALDEVKKLKVKEEEEGIARKKETEYLLIK